MEQKPHINDGLVWVFSTQGKPTKIHKPRCKALTRVKNTEVIITTPSGKEGVIEGEWPLVVCKCVKTIPPATPPSPRK